MYRTFQLGHAFVEIKPWPDGQIEVAMSTANPGRSDPSRTTLVMPPEHWRTLVTEITAALGETEAPDPDWERERGGDDL
jgi:hypothetical protein